jgi:signal transduction histidine kinase
VEHLRGLRGRMARLQGMVDGLLAQARLGHGPAVAETVDVAILVREVTSLLAPPAGFSIVCVGPMVALHTERAPLALVLRNLIGNAIGHHDRDIGVVTVAMRRSAGLAEFVVTDDGPGIPARFHARIFEKFQAVAGSDARTGGMGLALATAAVAAGGGTIRVESAPPIRGSRFVFTWRADAG